MNQDKIGKFILKLRKEKKMTQQELADKLGVTDRAISHWENGRSIPDVALFKSICEIFDISVNELMSGERKTKEKVKEQKKSSTKALAIIMTILFSIIFILLIIVLLIIGNKSSKIDLYNFTITPKSSDETYELEKQIRIDGRNVYYFGIESALFCNKKEECYHVADALKQKQITLDGFRDYLEKQVEYGNYKNDVLFDGGTTFYYKDGIEVIFCNTLDGNKDVYIGKDTIRDELKGEFCGKENEIKRFIRTYKVISSETNKEYVDLNNITVEDNKGNRGTILLGNNYVLLVGHTYEFVFVTYDKYEDTIENIFKNSTLYEVIETDKEKDKQINEEMIVNEELDNYYELFELEHVGANIDYDTLTRTGVRLLITDFSNNLYAYGSPYRIDKYENGKWTELKNNCSNDGCDWTLMAYSPDQYGHLYFNMNWKDMYGSLEDGRYRIVKDAVRNDEKCSPECKTYYFSVEFNLG